MNFNAIIALLELKGIITREEGEKLVEHLNNKPQSTMLADAIEQVKEFINEDAPKLLDKAKPAIEKAAKSEAEKVVNEGIKTAKAEAGKIAEKAVDDAKAELEPKAPASNLHTVPNTPVPPVKKVADKPQKK